MKKSKALQLALFVAVTTIYLAGCDDAKKSIKNVSEQPEMQGNFKADCKGVDVDGLSTLSSQDEIELVGNQLKVNTVYYSESNCNSESELGRMVYDGEFELERRPVTDIGQEVEHAAENVGDAVEGVVQNEEEREQERQQTAEEQEAEKDNLDAGVITLNLKEVYVEAKTQELASLLNGINFCGKSDYNTDDKATLTEVSGDTFCPVRQVPVALNGTYLYNEELKELVFSEEPTNMQEGEANTDAEPSESSDVVVPSYNLVEVFSTTYKKD